MKARYKIFRLVFLILLCTPILIHSSNNNVDSAQWQTDDLDITEKVVDSLNNFAFSLRGSDPAKAISIGKRAMFYAKNINYGKGILMSHSFVGVCYRNIADYTTAMQYYTKAFYLADSLGDKEQKAYAYNNIGNLYFRQQKDSLALRNVLSALELAQELNNERIIAYSYINLGRIYSNLEQWDESIKYLQKAVDSRKKLNDYYSVSNTIIEAADVHFKNKKYNLAIKNYNAAKSIVDTLQNAERLLAEIYSGIGKINFVLKNYNRSRRNFLRALDLSKKVNDKIKIMDNYKALSELSEKTSRIKESLNYHKHYVNYKDSVYLAETQNQANRLAIQYQTKEMDKENELLRKSNEIHKLELSKNRTVVNFLIVITILLVVIAFVIYSKMKTNQKVAKILRDKNEKINEQKEELEELNATKDKFFSIIAHDLRNPFGSLIGNTEYLIDELENMSIAENKEILAAIKNSSKSGYNLLETLLTWAKTQRGQIKFEKEKFIIDEIIDDNISLHKNSAMLKNINLIRRGETGFEIDADKKMLNTILNNLISNALKFTKENGSVVIESNIREDRACFSIVDDGIGMDSDEIESIFKLAGKNSRSGTKGESGTGLGLIICKEFIDAHSGLIEVSSEPEGGTKVYFEIPK